MDEQTQLPILGATGRLAELGWSAAHPLVAATTAPISRGTNTLVHLPPAPAWGVPALAALIDRMIPGQDRVLILTSPALVPEWGATLQRLVPDVFRVEAALGTARATRRIKAGEVDFLVISPETALALHSRSALQPDRFTTVVFSWPESWDSDEALTVLLQELPRTSQRLVFTASPDRVDAIAERYARKAARVGFPSEAQGQVGPLRVAPTPWSRRTAALASLVEVLDPERLTIWTADTRDHQQITAALGGISGGIALTHHEIPSRGGLIICYDPPEAATLGQLVEAGEVILLVMPGTEAWVNRIAEPRNPVSVDDPLTLLLNRDAGVRAAITQKLSTPLDNGLYVLGPLFERYQPQQVAAALYQLWQESTTPATTPVTTAQPVQSPTPVGGIRTGKIWVGVGKKDGATVADLVAVMVREVGLDRSMIGLIELRETFSLVEVPADDASKIVERLSGVTIRRRKISARIDSAPSGRGSRSAADTRRPGPGSNRHRPPRGD